MLAFCGCPPGEVVVQKLVEVDEGIGPDGAHKSRTIVDCSVTGSNGRIRVPNQVEYPGLLEQELWDARLTWARRFIADPFWSKWWQHERTTSNYSPSFLALLESEPSDGGPIV